MQHPQKRQVGALGLLLAFGCAPEPLPGGPQAPADAIPAAPSSVVEPDVSTPTPTSAVPNNGAAPVGSSAAMPDLVSTGPVANPDPVLRAYDPAELPPSVPLLGGTLLVTKGNQYAVAAIPASDEVSFVSLTSLSHAFSVSVAPGKTPARLTEDALGRVHAVLRGSHQVATIDPSAPVPVALLHDVCVEPRGIAFDAQTEEVVVACRSGEVLWFDAASLAQPAATELRRQFVARDLRDVIATQDGLFVSTFRAAELIELSREGVVQSRTPPNTVTDLALGGVFEPHVAHRMLQSSGASLLVQHQRSRIDDLGFAYYAALGCGNGATHNTLSVFHPGEASFQSIGVLPSGPMLDLAVSDDGLHYAVLAVASTGNSVVHQGTVDPGMRAPCDSSEVTTTEVDGLATALVFDAGKRLLLQLASNQALLVDGQAVRMSQSTAPLHPGLLPFYVPTAAGISCASCHPEGEEDGTTWPFRGGSRRTQPIAGRIAATAPLHWLGDRADFYQLLKDTLVGRMGGAMPELTRVQEMAEFLDALPVADRAPPSGDVERGKVLFEQLKCNTCHSGVMFTDNLSHDVGTGDVFQTASLRGVVYRAPFIHNGCAKTLRDRFSDCGGDQRHGDWYGLSDSDLDALVHYLESL